MKQKISFFTFLSAYRIVYTIPFVLASLTGVVRGYFASENLLLGLLILWEVFWLAMFVNLSNDYFDHLSGSDKKRFSMDEEKKKEIYQKIMNRKVYWQGNLFDLGYITKKQGKILLGFIVLVVLVSAYPLWMLKGSIVIIIGILGLFLSYFYTAPPLNLGAKGFGELNVLVSFFLISYFSAYVMTGNHSGDFFLLAVAVSISACLMRLADEMTGYDAHISAQEKDLSVRIGIPATIKLIFVGLGLQYAVIVLWIIRYQKWPFMLLFLTVPIALQIVKTYQTEKDEFRIIRAVPLLLKLSTGQSLLISIAWVVVFLLR